MESVNVRGYMHIYIGLFDNTIGYGSCPEKLTIGEALLRFIYADFQSLTRRPQYTIEDFRSFHPYFTCCDPLWQQAFIENLNHPADDAGLPRLAELMALQQQYGRLFGELYGHGSSCDSQRLAASLSDDAWLGGTHGFARLSLCTLHSPDTEDTACVEDYFVASLRECLFLELTEMIKRQITLKSCKNCGRFFIPKRANMDYCPRVVTADGKTCSEVGYTQTFARNVKNDELLLAYTRAYKAHYARMTKPRKKTPNMTREEFDRWYQEAKHKLEQARAGLMDPELFKKWLKE